MSGATVRVRRYGAFNAAVGALTAALVLAFGAIQLASDALYSRAGVRGTFPERVPLAFGLRVYEWLDRAAPAPYVEATLARAALDRGDADAAQGYALRLPASPVRDELLGRIAASEGQRVLAREYFLAAPDPAAIADAAQALAAQSPAAGYELERVLELRLARTATHPDAVAQTFWEMGRLANRQAWRQVPGSALQRAWLRRAFAAFESAVALAPLSERYLLEDANQADLLGERSRAERLFAHALDVDPGSADAMAGLGVIAWENGDRPSAESYLARARMLDAHSLMVRALERDLARRT